MQSVDYILVLVILEAALCLLLASYFFERTARTRKYFGWLFGVLALLSIGGFLNFGELRGRGAWIHWHEQYHFYLGSKYLKELRYDAIYDATILAAQDQGILTSRSFARRDPASFRKTERPITRERERVLRGRFTPERWQSFLDDVAAILTQDRTPVRQRLAYANDHGNTGSPSWAMVAGILTRSFGPGYTARLVYASVDVLLLVALFVAVRWTMGGRAMCLAMIIGLSPPLVVTYLGGSIMRMDWIVALGISLCLLEKKHVRTAGLLLGYAVSSKLIAGLIVLPFGIRFLIESVRERRVNSTHLRYILFSFVGLVACILASTLVFRDLGVWRDYFGRLLTAFHEEYYSQNHSFRDVFLQILYRPSSLWHPYTAAIAAADPRIYIEHIRGWFILAQVVLLAGLARVAARDTARASFALGPLAVFVLLVTNRYYWQMWVITAIALGPDYRTSGKHTAFLAAVLAWIGWMNFTEATRQAVAHGGYVGSVGLFVMTLAIIITELFRGHGARRLSSAA
jgi:hypothetical protein